ncbi:MAG: VWA domain-containing protein [Anaerolineae bacterium]|nr:VWA domain-containing protein [Anaerolineae bacterium]
MNTKYTLNALGVIIGLFLVGCGQAATLDEQTNAQNRELAAATEAPAADWGKPQHNAPADSIAESPDEGDPSVIMPAAPTMIYADSEKMERGDSASEASGGEIAVAPSSDSGSSTLPDQQFQSSLTAGEIDDNRDFEAYLQYRLDFMHFLGHPVHDRDVTERHIVRVRTSTGIPVLGAKIQVYEGQTLVTTLQTPATGIAYIFPQAYNTSNQAGTLNVVVKKGQAEKSFRLTRQGNNNIWDVDLNVQPAQPPIKLDVLFLLDSTGSMGDEIEQLRNNILSISAQIAALPSRPDVHFGMVTYRDRGDEYVTHVSDFTGDIQEFQSALMNVQAAGGGDIPESLNEALYRAINDVRWRQNDTVSLIFLVADAPPHLDYAQDYDYAQDMQKAVEKGIKIHPIASSDLDDQGEYIFRQLAQYTGGHFIFLTYQSTPQSSGEPGTEHHVQEGSYTVQDLDKLVVRLIQEELASLSGLEQ